MFYPSCSTPPWELEGVLKTLVDDGYKDIDAKMGVVRADAGYLSMDNVQMITDLGATPFVRPKKHPRFLSLGRPAWKEMLLRTQQDPEAFADELNQRWRAEAYFSKMKRRFANALTIRTGTMRRREV